MSIGALPFEVMRVFWDALLPPVLYCLAGAAADRYLEFDSRTLSRLIVYVLLPPLMFATLTEVNVNATDILRVAGFILCMLAGMAAAGFGYARLLKMDPGTASSTMMATTFFNGVNLGFPVALYSFGHPGLLAASVVVAVNAIPHNVCGLLIAARGALSTREAVRVLGRMPFLYVMGLAIALRLAGIEVPASVMEPISVLGRTAIPLALVCVGMELRRIKPQPVTKQIAGIVLLRLVCAPLLAWSVASLVGLTGILKAAAILQASMPTAVMPIVYARLLGGNVEFISRAVLYTTLASVITIPVLLIFLK